MPRKPSFRESHTEASPKAINTSKSIPKSALRETHTSVIRETHPRTESPKQRKKEPKKEILWVGSQTARSRPLNRACRPVAVAPPLGGPLPNSGAADQIRSRSLPTSGAHRRTNEPHYPPPCSVPCPSGVSAPSASSPVDPEPSCAAWRASTGRGTPPASATSFRIAWSCVSPQPPARRRKGYFELSVDKRRLGA